MSNFKVFHQLIIFLVEKGCLKRHKRILALKPFKYILIAIRDLFRWDTLWSIIQKLKDHKKWTKNEIEIFDTLHLKKKSSNFHYIMSKKIV